MSRSNGSVFIVLYYDMSMSVTKCSIQGPGLLSATKYLDIWYTLYNTLRFSVIRGFCGKLCTAVDHI